MLVLNEKYQVYFSSGNVSCDIPGCIGPQILLVFGTELKTILLLVTQDWPI